MEDRLYTNTYPQVEAKIEQEPVLVRLDRLEKGLDQERNDRMGQQAALEERMALLERTLGLRGRP